LIKDPWLTRDMKHPIDIYTANNEDNSDEMYKPSPISCSGMSGFKISNKEIEGYSEKMSLEPVSEEES
jgi:hypothetical protein